MTSFYTGAVFSLTEFTVKDFNYSTLMTGL